ESSVGSNFHVYLRCAVAAGLSTAIPYYFGAKSYAAHYEVSFPDEVDLFILLFLPCAYLTAAILLWIWRETFVGRKIPHWLSIPILGSLLFLLFAYVYAILIIHENMKFITSERVFYTCLFFLALSAYTTIFTGLVRYGSSIIKAIKNQYHRMHTT